MKETFNYLRKIYFFDALSDEEIRRIEAVCQEEAFDTGEIILWEGDVGDKFYIIIEGSVEIWKDYDSTERDLLSVHEPFQIFGELALVDSSPRSATAVARQPCRLLSIKRADFDRVISHSTAIAMAITRSISATVRTQNEKFVERLQQEKRELKRAYATLMREVEERRILEERLRQAQKMEAVGTLAGGIAHDFNNIFQAIQGYVSLMMLEKKHDDPDRERLKNIEKFIITGAELTHKLLGFAGNSGNGMASVSVNDILSSCARIYRRKGQKIRICEDLQEDLWRVTANPKELMGVFSAILNNSVEAMPGGGTIYIGTANIYLDTSKAEFHQVATGQFIKISVEDTGIGMTEETLERIFEPFFTTKNIGSGRGLSLASVYNVVKGYNGAVQASSQKGRGTTIDIYLPCGT